MYPFLKRLSDMILSCLAILVLVPWWIVIFVVIKIQSPGPVIYKAKRVGLNGNVFTMYKFRTMCVNSGKVHATTLRSDSRIYPFGAILRKTKLDETPQLFNVLKGEMSLVGPRPEDEINAGEIYKGEYARILTVKPGLSCPASLYDFTHGEKYDTEEAYVRQFLPQKLFLDLFYVRHRSYFYDVQIVLRTAITILCMIFGKDDLEAPKELETFNEEVVECTID